ncbi:hypothetical protein [Hafnia alvei]|uniref:hypothetical protein n=1 Tax=Hafnia alvei TaxID=569 RepID=UPI001034AC61|nr:hypothetical protein [Hafnia alvei]QHJ79274.1 MAG: hypothetical protein [Bacteriophage sp.]TBL90035.1 hypothetical protein EYY88_00805 [Hafnia alvei]
MNNLPIETYESVVQQRDELEKKLADVVAENAALNKFIKDDCWVWDDKNETYFDAIDCIPETPATDAFTRELMAKGVDMAACAMDGMNQFNYANALDELAQKLRKGINDAQ